MTPNFTAFEFFFHMQMSIVHYLIFFKRNLNKKSSRFCYIGNFDISHFRFPALNRTRNADVIRTIQGRAIWDYMADLLFRTIFSEDYANQYSPTL